MQVAEVGLGYDGAVTPACPEVHLSTLYCPYHPAGVVGILARTSENRKPGPGTPRPGTAKETEAAPQPAPTHFAIRISVREA